MTWKRTLDIGPSGATVEVVDGHIEIGGITDGERLTPLDTDLLADVLKRAARFAGRERELATTRRRPA